ncbi:MAG: hypothetical protein MRERC_6c005 [Mycoplasmataceae bacterium RC_NB112A]|nr:MAG: hypothetical protein MRERC_13c005 [Mycoplasmataceae bacterium RC_NB112A]KLL01927.1 MAG: hypothetical protein MRERC_6c005 [Mycoplasmataceae bacterium RC_NB112A]
MIIFHKKKEVKNTKSADEKTKVLQSLTPEQLGLKNYLERSDKKSLSQSELENLLGESLKEEKKDKRKNLMATIGGIFIVGIVIAIIIWIVFRISKKSK